MHRRADHRRLRAVAVQSMSVNAGSILVDNFLSRRTMLSGLSLEGMEQEEDDGTYVIRFMRVCALDHFLGTYQRIPVDECCLLPTLYLQMTR